MAPVRRLAALVLAVAAIAACSGDDAASDAAAATATLETVPPSTAAADSSTATAVTTIVPDSAPAPDDIPTTTASPSTAATTTVVVAEAGIPGLDSADAFCAAWSRFGGSWQVLLVASVFGGDEATAAELEVVAAPVVVAAYRALLDVLPAELASEADAVADGYFGPLARRADDAVASLRDAGATDADLDALGESWIGALAARDPEDPVVMPAVPGELEALVGAAAESFRTKRVGMADDPSLVIVAETPATDRFLETACPDQGALTGQEVPGVSGG